METQTFSKEEKEEIIRYGLDRIKKYLHYDICDITDGMYLSGVFSKHNFFLYALLL